MKLKQVTAETSYDLWLKPESAGEPLETGVGYFDPDPAGKGYRLRLNGRQWKVLQRDASASIDLNFHLRRGCARLAEVLQIAGDGSALVKVVFFNGEIVEIGDIEIGLDDHIHNSARKNGLRFTSTEELGRVLADKCTITIGSDRFFLLVNGPAAKADFQAEVETQEAASEAQAVVEEKYREFCLCGDKVRIPVERRTVDRTMEIFFATRINFKDKQKGDGALRLARGSVVFSDYTRTGRIRALAAGAMSQLTKATGSYLKRWDEYGAIEGDMLLARAKDVGKIEYSRAEKLTKGVKFFVSSLPRQLSEGDEMEVTTIVPPYLVNPDLTWNEYVEALEAESTSRKEREGWGAEAPAASVFAPILSLSPLSIELDLPAIPAGQAFLVLSINGDKIQIQRRSWARAAILEGRSANPLLGLLIEEGGTLPKVQRVGKLKPLTPFVKEKIFKHPPTERQIEAIDVALNTPDIALIQGPPGTGKTTVVTAILERLNEEYDKTKPIRGQILVSGFQHDAVENIVARLSVNALPAVKFGRRSGDSEFTEDAVTEKIRKWCSTVVHNIRSKNPQIAQTEDQVRLAQHFATYSLCPSRGNTLNLMKRVLELPRDVIPAETVAQAEGIIASLSSEMRPDDPSTLRLIRSLRVSEEGFADDGPARAIDLLDKLGDGLSEPEEELLEKAGRWRQGKPLDFLLALRGVKESLLYRYLPPPDFRTGKPREDVLRLMAEVSGLLEKKLATANRRDAILAEFLHELEDNPDGVREAIEDYNFVYAATTQQAEGAAIRRAKKKFDGEFVKYDTVIIDEAARTSPRDLLIPMAQAEKRIILVGDHRQLPHLIDEEVAKAMEADDPTGASRDIDFVKKSMFEYLFNRLKKLEQEDGVKRTVTLDAQYRTHPLLGTFASENFYRKYGEGYDSPLADKHFEQNLQGIGGKAAVWIDVPASQGKEVLLPSHSRQRMAEAKVIAEHANRWLKSPEGAGLSFGVITFYKAQVHAVYECLSHYNITERAPDGSWQIASDYRSLENGEELLRIGTVDAFQGMEFDVVFLSMVRSVDPKALPPRIRNEADPNKKQQMIFGHLMSENRLCVSMSRQKKVLAIVGNATLANAQIAVDAVPALKNYYDLCSQHGVIL